MRPLLEHHFAEQLDEMEDRLRHERRFKYSGFSALASSELISVRYHISQIDVIDDSLKMSNGSALRATLCLLNYDRLLQHEGSK